MYHMYMYVCMWTILHVSHVYGVHVHVCVYVDKATVPHVHVVYIHVRGNPTCITCKCMCVFGQWCSTTCTCVTCISMCYHVENPTYTTCTCSTCNMWYL